MRPGTRILSATLIQQGFHSLCEFGDALAVVLEGRQDLLPPGQHLLQLFRIWLLHESNFTYFEILKSKIFYVIRHSKSYKSVFDRAAPAEIQVSVNNSECIHYENQFPHDILSQTIAHLSHLN